MERARDHEIAHSRERVGIKHARFLNNLHVRDLACHITMQQLKYKTANDADDVQFLLKILSQYTLKHDFCMLSRKNCTALAKGIVRRAISHI